MSLSQAVKEQIRNAYYSLPQELRKLPATSEQLRAFESRFGVIPDDWRWFLQACGGGVIGSEWVDDIVELEQSHITFQNEFGPPYRWTMIDVFIIGWDGTGNPFGIERSTGRILVEDHDFGGIYEMASSVEELLSYLA